VSGRCRSSGLTPGELARAGRLRNPDDRARFVAARGLLRQLLGSYLSCPPSEVPLEYGEQGKPVLPAPEPLHFNLSHAGTTALLAVARQARVGVDVERVRPLAHVDRVARRVLTPEELAVWTALPPDRRLEDFFERWVRLEALAKMIGCGVWRLLADRPQGVPPARYLVLSPGERLVGAVAMEGERPLRLVERVLD